MRKLLTLAVVIILALSMTACDKTEKIEVADAIAVLNETEFAVEEWPGLKMTMSANYLEDYMSMNILISLNPDNVQLSMEMTTKSEGVEQSQKMYYKDGVAYADMGGMKMQAPMDGATLESMLESFSSSATQGLGDKDSFDESLFSSAVKITRSRGIKVYELTYNEDSLQDSLGQVGSIVPDELNDMAGDVTVRISVQDNKVIEISMSGNITVTVDGEEQSISISSSLKPFDGEIEFPDFSDYTSTGL